MNEELGGYITQLVFNDGTVLPLNKNDITVFVGPNNSGKSQSLRDIYNKCERTDQKSVVVRDIALKTSTKELNELLDKVAVKNNSVYYYLNRAIFESSFSDTTRFRSYRDVFVSFLQTEQRLSYCRPQSNINKGEAITHPMQFLIEDRNYRNKLSSLFEKAFQNKLYCYPRGKDISIRVGQIEDTIVSGNRLDVSDSVMEEISNLPHIENQGDGMKSFVSILLSLGLDYKRIHLFDEPESFLHQAQARIMGRMIGEELKNNQQAFVSTHSTDFIKGLLEKAESRIKIVRITRRGDTNSFHILDNGKIQDICNDEMLKHTNVMEGLFSNKVIVCESDVDCLLYSNVEEYMLNMEGKYSDSLFLYTGGKSSFRKTLSAIKGLGIEYRAVLDLDALNDETLIKSNYEVCGGDWERDVKTEYKQLVKWIDEQSGTSLTKEAARHILNNAIDKCTNDSLSPNDIKNIKSSLKNSPIWDSIKRVGRKAISDPSIVLCFDSVLSKLRSKNIFLIPSGEIESFFPDIEGHSHGWLQKVFKSHPSLDDPAYDAVKDFIKLL